MTSISSGPPSTPSNACAPKPGRARSKDIALSVLPAAANKKNRPSFGHSRTGRWRAVVLVGVHVLIAVHILLWLWMGTTVSPVEPSESMQTLREGAVNAGFVFFVLAILSTLVLGRFFCGWGCHIVALQDACSWMMSKVGVRPKPFRSRLLIWVPLGLAVYMFVWPVVHREVVRPLVMDERGRMPAWLGQSEPIPGITTEFIVKDFWATFAPWYIAIPFIGICTFGVVYFLGNKGFCTYGCPYGGIFAPADLVAPGKIRVTSDCEQCGHCTAVCTSNVRVHEEVRDFGMVVDPGCMKCMDCVSVCPNDALYFGFGKPTVLARPKDAKAKERRAQARAMRAARYDLKKYEEVAVAALFLIYFLCYRQMMNAVPMLMAVGMAGIVAFCTWKLWVMRPVKLGGTPNVRLQSLQLRLRGKWKAAGYVLALGTVLMMAVAVWSGYVRVTRYRASTEYAKLTTPLPIALRPEFQPGPAEADAADRALYLYTRGGRGKDDLGTPGVTGIGWKLTPDEQLQLAYIHVLRGDLAAALARMDRIIETGRPQDSLIFQAGQLMQALKKPDAEALAMYRRALDKHPELDGVRSVLAGQELAPGGKGADAARAILAPALEDRPIRPQALLSMARLELNINAPGASATALELAERAVGLKYGVTPDSLMSAAGVIAQTGDRETDPKLKAERRARAVALAERAAEEAEHGHGGPGTMISAAGLLAQFGQPAPAQDLAERAVAKAEAVGPHTGQTQTLVSAANLLAGLGKPERALELYRKAVAIITSTPRESAWDLHGMAFGMLQLGMGQRPSAALVEEGVRTLEKARDAAPSSGVIRSDLAMAYYAQGRKIDALREMTAAAEASDRSAFLASRLSDLLAEMDRAQEAVEWQRKATQREAAAQPR